MQSLFFVLAIVVASSLCYQLLPYRRLVKQRPRWVLMPKYKHRLKPPQDLTQITTVLQGFGFEPVSVKGNQHHFRRGKLSEHNSIRRGRVELYLQQITTQQFELQLKAGWVALFDQGEHWLLATALVSQLEIGVTAQNSDETPKTWAR